MRVKKENEVGQIRFLKGDPLRELREEGCKVWEVDTPRWIVKTPSGKVLFLIIKKLGQRLSFKEKRSVRRLEIMIGVETIICIQRGRSSLTKIKKLLTAETSLSNQEATPVKLKIEPYDPLKHKLSPEEKERLSVEIDEEQEREYQELLSILPKLRENQNVGQIKEEEKKGASSFYQKFILDEEKVE